MLLCGILLNRFLIILKNAKEHKAKFNFQLHPEKSIDKQVQKDERAKGCFIYTGFYLCALTFYKTVFNGIMRNFEEATR